jgi:hypothetical protein
MVARHFMPHQLVLAWLTRAIRTFSIYNHITQYQEQKANAE